MAAATTSGPFPDPLGISATVHTVVPQFAYVVTRGIGGRPIAYVLAAGASVHTTLRLRTFTFTDGTVWLVGSLLDATIPADGFVGLAFTTATLEVPLGRPPGPPGPPDTPLEAPVPVVVGIDETATLGVIPGPGELPAGPMFNDGSAATVQLPATAGFDLSPDGIALVEVGDAAATVYGSTTTLAGGSAGSSYDASRLQWVTVFSSVSGTPLDCSSPRSTTFRTTGSADVTGGSWRLPIARTTGDQLAPAIGSSLGLRATTGVSAAWGRLTSPVPLTTLDLEVRTGWLRLSTVTAAVRPFHETYRLWDAGGDPLRTVSTSLTLNGSRANGVVSMQSPAVDLVLVGGCTLEAHVDRPLRSDGSPPQLDQLSGSYAVGVGTTGPGLMVAATGTPGPNLIESYVLQNALLRTGGTTELVLFATLVEDAATTGTLVLASDLQALTPTLPDPYAASLSDEQSAARTLLAAVAWTSPPSPAVAFEVVPSATSRAVLSDALGHAAGWVRAPSDTLDTLFDVSSASDQWGVTLATAALAAAQIDGQTLQVPGQLSALYALPQIAWEAVITDDAAGDRFVFPAFARSDGPATVAMVPTQQLRPMTPDAFLRQFVTDFEAGSDLLARFTLPFGIEAFVDTRPGDPASRAPRPALSMESAAFGTQTGGRQLAITARTDGDHPLPMLPGSSFTTTDAADIGYPDAILDPDIASFWNQEFEQGLPDGRPFVPLERIALSGYGSSTFSDYEDPDVGVGVSEARFDVVVGRTSYALVQIQSVLCPWGVRVVNTTIFQRDGAGWVQRRNTGWRAKGPGRFEFGRTPAETGAVTGLFDVRNIVELDVPHVNAAGKDWAQVTFDTDVELLTAPLQHGLTIRGGDIGGGRLAGHRFSGWIDLTVGALPALNDVLALMDVVHTAAGSVSAEVEVAGTGIAMTVAGVDVAATTGAPRALGVAVRGVPLLPRDGSWSVARRSSSQTTPSPVHPLTPVPLVRHSSDPSTWHLAEPADIQSLAAPDTLYSIVQSTGTQQLLFEHPTISDQAGRNPLTFDQTPKLADVGALLGSGGLLPHLPGLLDFPSFTGLTPVGDGLGTTQTLTHTTTLPDTVLIPLGPISVVLATNVDPILQPPAPAPARQSVVTVVIDPTANPRWSISITNVAFKLLVDGMSTSADPLVSVIGDIVAADRRAPTVEHLQFAYGSSLSVVKDVLSGIQALADALPGGGGTGLDVHFSGSKLSVRDAVSLPQLPLGLGYLEGVSLELGFDLDVLARTMNFNVGVGSPQHPFSWLASPLAGNGMLQLGAGQSLGVVLQGGIGVGLGIDLAVASGSASVCIAVQLDTTKTPFGVMVLLTGNAAVDVLDGLASASLTLTAGLGVQVSPGPPGDLLQIPPLIEDYIAQTSVTLSAEVAVAIHLSVCWLVHVDWSGSWGFAETVSGSALTSVLP